MRKGSGGGKEEGAQSSASLQTSPGWREMRVIGNRETVHVCAHQSGETMRGFRGEGGEMNGKDTALFSKASDEWGTPQWLFDLLNEEFHFNVDAASRQYITQKCNRCFTDALTIEWTKWGERFWLNPPYSKIGEFMKKAYEESQKGAVVVCLIPARTDTRYWHDYVMKAQEIRFVKGRLKFGDSKNSAPFPSVIVIFRKETPMQFLSHPYGPVIGPTIEQPKKVPV
jgi:site-specific DNA-methyltransferase (adenine-specific)